MIVNKPLKHYPTQMQEKMRRVKRIETIVIIGLLCATIMAFVSSYSTDKKNQEIWNTAQEYYDNGNYWLAYETWNDLGKWKNNGVSGSQKANEIYLDALYDHALYDYKHENYMEAISHLSEILLQVQNEEVECLLSESVTGYFSTK